MMVSHKYSYDEAITKFIEEYIEMPAAWYTIKNGKKVLFPLFVHIAISILIVHEVFTLVELKEEFYFEYGMVLKYNTANFGYWE